MKKWIWIGVVAVVAIFFYATYNGFVNREEGLKSAWSNVETQYQRRADLIPNLVNTVKGYAAHETQTLNRGYRGARPGHVDQPFGRRPDARETRAVPAGAVAGALGAGTPDCRFGELSRPEGEPEFPRTAGPARGYREPHRRCPQGFQHRGAAVQRFGAPFPGQSGRRDVSGFEQKPYFESAEGSEAAPEVTF